MDYLPFISKIVDIFSSGKHTFNKKIDLFLEYIGESLNADRVYWFKAIIVEDAVYTIYDAEWTREGISPQKENPDIKFFPHKSQGLYDYLSKNPYFMAKVSEIEDENLKEILINQEIKSMLLVPLFINGNYLGFLGIDNVLKDELWTEDDISFLKLAAYIFGTSLLRHESEVKLSEAILHLDTLLNSFPDIIIIKDREGKWLFANNFTIRFFGLEDIDYKGKKNEDLAEVSDVDLYKDAFLRSAKTDREIIESKKPIKYIKKYEFPDEREIYFEVRKVPIYDENKDFKGILVIAKDITEDVKLEKKMEEKERLESLGLMAGKIAHDLNNILTAILGSASLLQIKAPPHLVKYVETILKASHEAKELATQMLSYVGNRVIQREVFNLGKEIQSMEKFLKTVINNNIDLDIEVIDKDLFIEGNKSQIQQIVTNLVVNASDAIGGHRGKITVRVYRREIDPDESPDLIIPYTFKKGKCVEIDVEDTGPGMSEEVRKHIFDPFFTTKEKGKGLGLFSVFGIVKSYNGAIEIKSKLGKGTIFRIYLPESPVKTDKIVSKRSNYEEEKGKKVLVVDDEKYIRELLRDMLSFLGFQPFLAESGKKALEILSKEKDIELIITDYTMPEMNGLELLHKVKELRPDIGIIFSSGYAEEDVKEFSEKKNVVFLQKPYTMDALREALHKIGNLI